MANVRVLAVPSGFSGTIESSSTIQPAPWGVPHCTPMVATGTIEGRGTTQRALWGAPHYCTPIVLIAPGTIEQWHYSIGTMGSPPLLYPYRVNGTRHYREQWHYSTGTMQIPRCTPTVAPGTIEGRGTIQSAL